MESLQNNQVKELPETTAVRPQRVLIVEDDITVEPTWEYILRRASKNIEYRWVTTEKAAEETLEAQGELNRPFDLVISDVFLSGSLTGIDLWEKFQDQLSGKFILVSGIEYNKLNRYLAPGEDRLVYLKKPLNVPEAIQVVHFLLTK